MSVDRAIVRIALFGSVIWFLFWGWRYITGCIRVRGMILFCPNAGGQTLIRTDYLHMGFFLLLPPLLGLLVSVLVYRNQRQ